MQRAEPVHDELLFVVVHQAFELWSKRILFELEAVLQLMGARSSRGFQSVQFRLIENTFGLRPSQRLKIRGSEYSSVLSDEHVRDFWCTYQQAVEELLAGERRVIETHPHLDDAGRAEQLATLARTHDGFDALFDADRDAELLASGRCPRRRCSQRCATGTPCQPTA